MVPVLLCKMHYFFLKKLTDTGGGAVVDDFQLIRANLALPSCSPVSVEEDFLVVPTLRPDSSSC
jgi:hypothetical protein